MTCENDSRYCSCLYYSAGALARAMTKMAEEEFSITQLAPSYAFLLMTVNYKPGIQPKEISRIMMLTPSTVTRLIEKMEFKGFLQRKSTGKFTEVFPKQKSLDMNDKIQLAWSNLLDRYTSILGKAESKQLTEDIYTAVINLQK